MSAVSTADLEFQSSHELVEVDPSSNPPKPMRLMLVLDPEAEPPRLYVDSRYQASVTGTPMVEFHNRQHTFELPADVDAREVKGWAEKHLDLFQAMVDAHETHWDGSNNVGTALDSETQFQVDGALRELPLHNGGLWDAADYYAESGYSQAFEDGQLDPKTATEADLADAAGLIEMLALDEGAVLYGTVSMLEHALEEARESS
jgi:hypothetical protein